MLRIGGKYEIDIGAPTDSAIEGPIAPPVEEHVPSIKDNPAVKQPNQVVSAAERLQKVCTQQ